MGVYIPEILQTPEDYAVAVWLIICKNSGQSTATMARHHVSFEQDFLPSSQLFAALLRQCPQFFPAFYRFSEVHRKQILLCIITEKLHGIKDLVLPEVALLSLIDFDKRALQLYVLQCLFTSSL
jgi:hypothetical protein